MKKTISILITLFIIGLCSCSKSEVQNNDNNNSSENQNSVSLTGGNQTSISQIESGGKDEFGIDYVEIDNYYNASIKKELPNSIQLITIDNEHNGKPVVGFYLSTDDTVSIDTIIIPENCENVCVNSPNITINKIIINGTKDTVSCTPMFCKNTPVIEYTK